MPRFAAYLTLGLLAQAAVAQNNCFDTNFGTPLGSATTLFGDVMLPMQSIGFAFPLGGVTYTDIHIADKGYVHLSNANVPAAPMFPDISATAAELASDEPRIAALWSDLQVLFTANSGQIYLNSTATKCTVTWENIACYAGNCPPFTMQLQMLSSGEVYVFYSPGATNNSSPFVPDWQVGVAGISPGFVTLGSLTDLSAGGVTASNLIVDEWPAPNTFDMPGRGLHYVPTSPGYVFNLPFGCAASQAYGTGCVLKTDSVYEEFLSGFDLNNTTISWFRNPAGYTMLTGVPGTFVTPSGTAINIAPNTLDGDQVVTLLAAMPVPGGTTNTFNVTTKGQVEFANSPGNIDFTPSAAEMLAWPRTAFHCWHDYDQTDPGSGLILFEEVAGVAYVTWNGVHSYSASVPSTFQFQFDLASGNVQLVMQVMNGVANPDAIVIGYSVGGPSPDPGATDLSLPSTAVTVFDAGASPLKLATSGMPTPGSTTFAFNTSNVPNLLPLGFLFFGDTVVNPGIDLTFLGMPGCSGYTNANFGALSFPVALPAGTGSLGLPIPNNPGLIGASLTSQSIAFSFDTPANLVSSNGMVFFIGT